MAEIFNIDKENPTLADVRPVVDLLLDGKVAAGPTSTFYALMAAADRPEALNRILDLKGRDSRKPLLVLIDSPIRVGCYAREAPDSAKRLVDYFWPGPLTLLFQAHNGLPEPLVGPYRSVGLRMDGLPWTRLLVRAIDRGVTGTSANPAGAPPARTAEEVQEYFGNEIDLIVDGGPCPGGYASTIIDVSQRRPRLIRAGSLSLNRLFTAAPDLRT